MTEPNWVIADRYRVLGRIGTGGMADVLRAHDELLDRDVAVKVFRTVLAGPDGSSDTAKGVERQRAELAALAQLNHPNLTTLYDGSIVGQDGPAYLVMELIDGPSLAQAIIDGGLTEAQARIIGAQIGDALAYVHSAGMVHRDVKPANILLGHRPGEGMRARLTDFGIVRLVGNEPLTQADMTLGSASYLAPEQARGSAVGPPADVYALGLTLIEAITGRRSFDGPAIEAVVARLSNDPEIPAGLPQPWPSLLRAMTARDPAQRPTAARVASALRGAESVTAPITSVPAGTYDTAVLPAAVAAAASAPPVRPPTRTTASPRREPQPERRWSASLIVAGILVLALIVAGITLLLANSSSNDPGSPATSPQTSTTRGPSHTRRATPTGHRTRSHSSTPTPSTTPPTTSSTPTTTTPTTTAPSTPSTQASSTTTRSSSSAPSSTSISPSRSRTPSAAGAVKITPSATATTSHRATRSRTGASRD